MQNKPAQKRFSLPTYKVKKKQRPKPSDDSALFATPQHTTRIIKNYTMNQKTLAATPRILEQHRDEEARVEEEKLRKESLEPPKLPDPIHHKYSKSQNKGEWHAVDRMIRLSKYEGEEQERLKNMWQQKIFDHENSFPLIKRPLSSLSPVPPKKLDVNYYMGADKAEENIESKDTELKQRLRKQMEQEELDKEVISESDDEDALWKIVNSLDTDIMQVHVAHLFAYPKDADRISQNEYAKREKKLRKYQFQQNEEDEQFLENTLHTIEEIKSKIRSL